MKLCGSCRKNKPQSGLFSRHYFSTAEFHGQAPGRFLQKNLTKHHGERWKNTNIGIWLLLYYGYNKKENPKGSYHMYEFRNVRGHVEVYDNRGQFLFSADNEREAREELEETAA